MLGKIDLDSATAELARGMIESSKQKEHSSTAVITLVAGDVLASSAASCSCKEHDARHRSRCSILHACAVSRILAHVLETANKRAHCSQNAPSKRLHVLPCP